ncbi:Cna B-type domain-containing protein [Methanobrevibacter sp.]|uniref:Cna B-type domain-containing protein n=1 Tax=Methanobrevibacter sp. TaxID=66852 RepID=UPI003870A18C
MNRKLTLILALLILAVISVSIVTAVNDADDSLEADDESDDVISQDDAVDEVSADDNDEKIAVKETEDDKLGDVITQFSVKKVWNDDNDAKGKRPSSIKVIITVGNDKKELQLSDKNDWKDNVTNVQVENEDSVKIEEVTVDGYTTEIKGNPTDGYVITNTLKKESNSTSPTDKDSGNKKTTDKDSGDKDSKKETTIIKKTTTTTTKEVPVKKEAKEVKNESKKDPNKEKLKHDTGNPVLLGVLAVALVGLAYALYRRE